MSAKHLVAGYKISCACGQRVNYRHTGPLEASATALWRGVCPDCGAVIYASMPGGKAYAMRPDTLTLQLTILDIFAEFTPPLTVRQVYYQCTVKGVVPKTDAGYRKVQQQMTVMRRAGTLPYNWVADSSRYALRARTYSDLPSALGEMQRYYRRDLWQAQHTHVEVWVEKKALIGVLHPVCDEFGVSLFPCGGYSSISFVVEAAEQLRDLDKQITIYHLGDFDYDGVHAAHTLENELRRHGAQFEFRRLALTWEQVQSYALPTRPQKKNSTRKKWFIERYGNLPACELDALPPDRLREMVHNAITQHIDPYEWERLQTIEAEERQTLATIMEWGWQA